MNSTDKLTKNELAQRLRVSLRQIDIMVNRQELPPGKRCGRQLYWVDAVAAKCEERRFAEQLGWAQG